jgi:hypothetical protein
MAEFIGPINNRVLLNLLDQNFKSGSISAKEYRDLKKQFFGKPKLIQMELFPKDPKKKQKGGFMEQTNGLKKMGLKKGGRIRGPKDLKERKAREKLKKAKERFQEKRQEQEFNKLLEKFKKDNPSEEKKLTPQQKKDLRDKMLKDQGKMTNPFLKFNKLGQPYMEAKKGGLAEATAKLKAQGLKKGGFPDLSGDGKVTMKDILMGRGVVKKPKKKQKGGSIESIFKLAKAAKPSGRLSVDDIKRATPGKPSMTLKKGKLKGVKDAPEERRKERQLKSFDKLAGIGKIMKGLGKAATGPVAAIGKAGKKAGRLAKRGYGKARK